MTSIYETEDGQEFAADDVKRKSRCDFCGKTGEVPREEGFVDGDLPSIHGEGINGDYADICRECLTNGVEKDRLEKEIGAPEELKQETIELT